MKKRSLVLAAVGLLVLAGGAMAATIINGPSVTGNSWTQEFYENGLYPSPPPSGPNALFSFDKVAVQMVTGDLGIPPTDVGMSAGGWTCSGGLDSAQLTLNSPAISVNTLYFDVTFAGTPSENLAFHYQIYLDNKVEGTEFLQYDGATGGWAYLIPDSLASTAVPEPVSVIFFGTGLAAVGGFLARRRMLRNARAGTLC